MPMGDGLDEELGRFAPQFAPRRGGGDDDEDDDGGFGFDDEEESEGCLSFPGERFPIRRSARVILRARDLEGEPYELVAEGWLARILQHEYDHLDGVIYVDRLEVPIWKTAQKTMRKRRWGVPGNSWTPGVDDLEG